MVSEMTSPERVTAAVNDEPVDRLPVAPLACGVNRRLIDATYKEYSTEPDAFAKAMIEGTRHFDLDVVVGLVDLCITSHDMGGEIEIPEESTVKAVPPESWSAENYEELEAPGEFGERVQFLLEGTRKIGEEIGDEAVFFAFVEGPLLTLTQIASAENVFRDMYRCPDAVHKALEETTKYVADVVRAFGGMKGVAGVALDYLWGNTSCLGEEEYREFEGQYEPKIRKAVEEAELIYAIHNCAESLPFDIQIREYKPACINNAYYEGRGKNPGANSLIREYGDETLLIGEIDPQLFRGSPDRMKEAVRNLYKEVIEAFEETGHTSKYVLASGCEVPPALETNLDAIRAFVDAADEYGPGFQKRVR